MSINCYFDLLPVELLYELFNYFSTHEILYSFSDISSYTNAVLLPYITCQLDLKSIEKSDFDYICRHIQPEKVLSLRLSDDHHTPGLSKLFLSRFRFEQFTQLKSLTLAYIEYESLKVIFSSMSKLRHLRSLSFDLNLIRYTYSKEPNANDYVRFNVFNYHFRNIEPDSLTQLHHVSMNRLDDLTLLPLSNLRYLQLEQVDFVKLVKKLRDMPKLKSLCISSWSDSWNFRNHAPSNGITRLKLNIIRGRFSTNEMEDLLSTFPYLKHLELTATVDKHHADGYQLQKCVKSLITFNFKFSVENLGIDNTIKSFSTQFWLDRGWYVAYDGEYLFSVPHFIPHADHVGKGDWYIHTTTPNKNTICDRIKEFSLSEDSFEPYYGFKLLNINQVIIHRYDDISFDLFRSMIDQNQIKSLKIYEFNYLIKFLPLQTTMPNVRKLVIDEMIIIPMIRQLHGYKFNQIRELVIKLGDQPDDYLVGEIVCLFPEVQDFLYACEIKSKRAMIRFINGFQHLSHAQFCIGSSSTLEGCFVCVDEPLRRFTSKFYEDPYSITKYLRRLTRDNFVCRIYYSDNNRYSCNTHLWITKQPTTHFQLIHWLRKREYYCYQFIYIFFSILKNNWNLIQYPILFMIGLLICMPFLIMVGRYC